MAHDHHHHEQPRHDTAFGIGITLNIAFVIIETIWGLMSGSLALLADAGHNLSDVLGLMLAWAANLLTQKRPTARHTYGLRRSSILAALLNALLLCLVTGGIAWEAVRRLHHPAPVTSTTVIVVAFIGIIINGFTAILFHRGGYRDLNLRAAFLHMATDAGISAGVVVGALILRYTGWLWVDPVLSLAIVAIILYGTWGILREALNLALDAVPQGIDRDAVENYLRSLPGVQEVHDIHIWGMSTTETALTAHLVKPLPGDDDALLDQACQVLHDRFHIQHATLQIERQTHEPSCRLTPE